MQPITFSCIVALFYAFPIYCLDGRVKEKVLNKCRSYKESLRSKEGIIDQHRLSAHDDSCDCGREVDQRIPFVYRIVSTDYVLPLHKYPWIVQIRIAGEQWGAGVIITPSYVLTAGHVAKHILVAASYSEDNEVSLKDASVAVATQSKNTQFVIFRIHQVKFYPKFETYGEYPMYDIALLKLKDAIIFSKRVRPICLTTNKNLEKNGENATIIGWGKMEQGGNTTRRLKHGVVPLVDPDQCKRRLRQYKKYLGNFTICAGGNKFEDACEGDSGGPLQIQDECNRWTLLGLASWGDGCGHTTLPGVYTRVQYFFDWIIRETKDGMSCDSANAQRIEPNLKQCGIPSYRYMKTGIAVQILNYPFVVSLYHGPDFLGNGVLINSSVVLTTTSVINPWGPSMKALNLTVNLGTPAHYRNASDYLYNFVLVKEILFHPFAEYRFDLCLLVLGVAMADSLMKFHPICFTNSRIPFEIGDTVDITSYTGSFLFKFKVAEGKIRHFSKCKALKTGEFYYRRGFCVAQTTENFTPKRFDSNWPESCQGERGAVISSYIAGRHYLLGLSSSAPETCHSPRIFHDVNWALNWIRLVCTMLDVA